MTALPDDAGPGPRVDAAGPGPRVGVLALQGDVREHLSALAAVGAEPVTVRRPEDLDSVDALVLPGGESTVIARLVRTFGLMEPLREAIAGGLPVLGTCAGMILMADTIQDPARDAAGTPQETIGGLDVVVERNAFGRQVDSFETDLALTDLALTDLALIGMDGTGADPTGPEETVTVRAVFIRAPRVVRAGPSVEILAAVDGYPVVVRQGSLLATSFHPESTGHLGFHRWLARRAQTNPRRRSSGSVSASLPRKAL